MVDRKPRGLALVGSRAAGKTTVGRLLAERLGWSFLDADRELEARAGRTVAALFAERGESAFRDLEEQVLGDLTARPRLVLATGGGAVLRATNREALRRFGFVAWLDAPAHILADRLRADPTERPALTAAGTLAEVADVLAARAPLYRSVADAVIDTTGRSPEQVADAVIDAWSAAGMD
jgi:shikimate kinase